MKTTTTTAEHVIDSLTDNLDEFSICDWTTYVPQSNHSQILYIERDRMLGNLHQLMFFGACPPKGLLRDDVTDRKVPSRQGEMGNAGRNADSQSRCPCSQASRVNMPGMPSAPHPIGLDA